ncbi:MAG TPA: penicillin-binding transpeptidase domain-containing protein [Pontiella sp.]
MAMKVRSRKEASPVVIWTILGLMLLGMSVLGSKLWQLQVKRKSGFEEVFNNQSVRRVRLPAVRGKIYDTHGTVLADSIPNYCIAIYTEELRAPRSTVANTLELMHTIWQKIGAPPDVTYHDIKRHIELTPDEPLMLYKKLNDTQWGRWQQQFGEWSEKHKVPGLKTHDPLVSNQIVIHTSELKKRSTTTAANTLELIYEISERIGVPRKVRFQDIKDHIYSQRPLPLLAWENIDEETMAKWADRCSSLAGTDIYCKPDRTYPEGEALAHLIGFTLEADAIREEEGERVHFDIRGIRGRKGLESTYNELLEGEPGHQLVQIDVSGFRYRDLQTRPPKAGGDLQLTIDSNIQRFAIEALTTRQDGEDPNLPVRGACVVLDPNNGDVLAMASSPSFDPNIYMQSKRYRQSLLKDTSARTYHRAVFGQYPPGSTFKPLAALGVLRENPDYNEVLHDCRKGYKVGKRRMRCWAHKRGYGHGEVDVRQALMYSCNVFMFDMAQAVGYAPIRDISKEFGIGQYAGLFHDLETPIQNNSKYGNLPEKAINTVDLCNMSIGQGRITASPLQMAMTVATIANGGRLYRPRLVEKFRYSPDEEYRDNPTWAIRHINIPSEALEIVRGGMYDVVHHEEGTATKVRIEGVKIAGKTGSAQYRKKVGDEVVDRTHTWMISYAPFDFPRYAVAMLVEDGVSGGNTVGPRLRQLYRSIFEYDGTLARSKS